MTTRRRSGTRADARLNREHIVAAARDLIAEHGPEVPTEAIARRAAVGAATVYRHFPDRPALISAVALACFHHVVEIARAAEDEEPRAWDALLRFLRRSVAELRLAAWLSVWFASTWADLRGHPENRRLRRALVSILDRLVRRAQDDGDVRPDIDLADLLLMLAALLRPIPGLPLPQARQNADRHLVLLCDGLRARPDLSPLPAPGTPPDGLLDRPSTG